MVKVENTNTPPGPSPVCSNPADHHSSKAPRSRLLHASTLIHLKFPRRLLCASSPIVASAVVLFGCCCAPIAGQVSKLKPKIDGNAPEAFWNLNRKRFQIKGTFPTRFQAVSVPNPFRSGYFIQIGASVLPRYACSISFSAEVTEDELAIINGQLKVMTVWCAAAEEDAEEEGRRTSSMEEYDVAVGCLVYCDERGCRRRRVMGHEGGRVAIDAGIPKG
ncbi:hypothetical protein E3N88_26547 [Mikania micrantha]|uniref:Uncharacterized protein n=1 Tax=Mikania micrantha TaxID=192012 RepID=A0A5N6MUZ6_9ASTR|nr:hypothetical protein E3N88_26547 [Mikania micrantha]